MTKDKNKDDISEQPIKLRNAHVLTTEQEVDKYIDTHKEWWTITKLQKFVERIPSLVVDNKLRLYFSLAVGKLRRRIQDEQLEKDLKSIKHRSNRNVSSIEPGDIYGAPRFFRYGEGGKSKKKNGSRGVRYQDEGRIVDNQFREVYREK